MLGMIKLSNSTRTLLTETFSHSFTDNTFGSNTYTITHNFGKDVGSLTMLVHDFGVTFTQGSDLGFKSSVFDYYDNAPFGRGYVWDTNSTIARVRVWAIPGKSSPATIQFSLTSV